MILRISTGALAAIAAVLALAPAQAATSNGIAVQRQWSTMDKCAKLAIQKFPDHAAADLAKRDEFTRQCQRNARVPVREGLAPK